MGFELSALEHQGLSGSDVSCPASQISQQNITKSDLKFSLYQAFFWLKSGRKEVEQMSVTQAHSAMGNQRLLWANLQRDVTN